jgi:ankyrin repeat protein
MTNHDPPDAPWGTVETRFDPIHSAARMRDVQDVQNELSAGVDVDLLNGRAANGDGGNTAMWFAAQGPTSGLEVARLLIEAGADLNRRCEHGRTALHIAAAWGHVDVVQLLLEHGADPEILDDEGLTAAMMAARSKRVPDTNLKQVVDCLNGLDPQTAG